LPSNIDQLGDTDDLRVSALPDSPDGLVLGFYGDDFTGSTDVMEALELAGVPTVLFLEAPTDEQLRLHPDVRAVGVAGISRTMSPEQMSAELPAVFDGIARLQAPLFHYKVCSTFDSAPHVGSIGRAAELLRDAFGDDPIPVVVGVPELRRYTVFGTLFAAAGDTVYRIDRHPTMMRHPMTPMTEADLRIHLAAQTELPIALVDTRALGGAADAADAAVDAALAGPADLVLLDVHDALTQQQAGRQLTRLAQRRAESGRPLVVIGSSGVEYALRDASSTPRTDFEASGPPLQTVVIAGSRSHATAAQIEAALAAGFADVPIDPFAVTDAASAGQTIEAVVEKAAAAFRAGEHVLLRTPEKTGSGDVDGTELATALGRVAAALAQEVRLRRVVVAGGDTSGLVTRALGLESLRVLRRLAPGAPLCRATSADEALDGLEICLKSGQVGEADYFVRIAALPSVS
jgi:uncharacterized protein YgbK (DUF1537 family)